MGRFVAAAGMAALVCTVVGCPSLGGYFCADDSDCDRGGQGGVCLADHACGYPDASGECDSGLVRSPNADRLPGACVPVGDVAGGSSGEQSSATAGQGDFSGTGVVTGSGQGETTSGPAGCGSRVSVELDVARISPLEAIVGYPLYLRFEDPQLLAALREAGDTIVVTDASGTPLDLEHQDATGDPDAFAMWVTLPEHSAGDFLTLYVQWGGQPMPTEATEVWRDYVGVWHFDTPPNGVEQQPQPNSATPTEPGRTLGAVNRAQGVAGLVGGSIRFDGSDDSVDVPASFVGTLDSYTVSMWARYEGDTTQQDSYFQRLNGDSYWPRCWRQANPEDPAVFCQYQVAGETLAVYSGYGHPNDTWVHIALVRDAAASESRLYVDGQVFTMQTDPTGALAGGTNPFQIGFGEWGSFPGTIDEVRVATTPIPAAWIAADANHHRTPTAAITVGSPEALPCN